MFCMLKKKKYILLDFSCLNFLRSFRTKNKLESHNRACENKDFCNVNLLMTLKY